LKRFSHQQLQEASCGRYQEQDRRLKQEQVPVGNIKDRRLKQEQVPVGKFKDLRLLLGAGTGRHLQSHITDNSVS
jgi:hypothetical protein